MPETRNSDSTAMLRCGSVHRLGTGGMCVDCGWSGTAQWEVPSIPERNGTTTVRGTLTVYGANGRTWRFAL